MFEALFLVAAFMSIAMLIAMEPEAIEVEVENE